nr:hypothetical protein [Tanacetum cinerariifolium]
MSADVARGHGGDGGGGHPKAQFLWQQSGQAAYPPGDPEPQTQFDLRPHMESDRWPQIYASIQQHLQKIYNDWDEQLAFWNDPKNLARAA